MEMKMKMERYMSVSEQYCLWLAGLKFNKASQKCYDDTCIEGGAFIHTLSTAPEYLGCRDGNSISNNSFTETSYPYGPCMP